MANTAWADTYPESNSGLRVRPIDNYGKKRVQYFHYKNLTGGTLPLGTQIGLGFLPSGSKRILMPECWARCPVAGGATTTLSIGLRAYTNKYNPEPQPQQAEDPSAFLNAKDVSGVLTKFNMDAANDLAVDLYSTGSVEMFATFGVAVMPINWELEGYFTVVTE